MGNGYDSYKELSKKISSGGQGKGHTQKCNQVSILLNICLSLVATNSTQPQPPASSLQHFIHNALRTVLPCRHKSCGQQGSWNVSDFWNFCRKWLEGSRKPKVPTPFRQPVDGALNSASSHSSAATCQLRDLEYIASVSSSLKREQHLA